MPSTPVCVIDATGITQPDFNTVLAYFQNAYRAIYGADVYLGNDSQDGQWMALLATAFNDQNAAVVSAFNARSPASAQGAGLSSVVKINGIHRSSATYSSVDLRIVGQAGATITDGVAADDNGVRWLLPASVTIPQMGEILVTAVADTIGAFKAVANTVTSIATPTYGWQTVSNPAPAVPGLPVESDAALRQRQTLSTMIGARTNLEGTAAALAAIPGVVRVRAYENDTNFANTDGLPGHSNAFVVDGGDLFTVAGTIALRKGPVGTYGTTVIQVGDALGIPRSIAFSRSVEVPITYNVTLRALSGYSLDVQGAIADAIVGWTGGLGIGGGAGRALLRTRVFGPALLPGSSRSTSFELLSIRISRDGLTPGIADIGFGFNERPTTNSGLITFTVVP